MVGAGTVCLSGDILDHMVCARLCRQQKQFLGGTPRSGWLTRRNEYISGLGLGSQLLATLSPTPLTTDVLRADYFQEFLATGPTPFFNKTMIYRKLSKVRGCAVHYGSSLPLSKTHYHYPCVCISEMKT